MGDSTKNEKRMVMSDPLDLLDAGDREALLVLERRDRATRLVQLNRTDRYHNSLDVIALAHRLSQADQRKPIPVPSAVLPASSPSLPEGDGDDPIFAPFRR